MGPIEGIFIALGWVIFAIFIILIFRYIGRGSTHRHGHMFDHGISDSSDPKDILKTRYAKGEVTKDEYLDILKTLESKS